MTSDILVFFRPLANGFVCIVTDGTLISFRDDEPACADEV